MSDERQYPLFPAIGKTDTSAEAAAKISDHSNRIQLAILKALRAHSLTTHELSEHLKIPYSSLQPRTSELRAQGKIIDSGRRRKNPSGIKTIVWALVTEDDVPEQGSEFFEKARHMTPAEHLERQARKE